MIGKTISHYKILSKIGEGGMGEVYLAEDTKLKRKVAIKFLPEELTKDNEANERFQREAQAAAALNHPNIVTIYEINEHEDQTYIAMEYVEGETLKDKITSGPLLLTKVVDYAIQICEGLSKAHEAGIVHRDIKPQNIIINRDGQVKILDFGLAKLKGVNQLTREQSTLGTIHYMSPEQAMGKEVDYRTDIWSLGVVLYEMLTGELPFKGEYDQAIIYSIINEEPEQVTGLRTDVPLEFQRVINKALSKELKERFQGISELLVDLKVLAKKVEPGETFTKSPKEIRKPSIAVLPFENMSTDAEQEYFCDGMTEEIINALTHIKNLKVIARTSAFMFKGKHEDMREIGKKLDVEHLLEGSVRKAGNRLRIIAQLIKVSDGSHIWSEPYERDLEDVFAIKNEIAREIAHKLKTSFRDKSGAHDVGTLPDMGAYELYLKGRYHFNKFSPEWINQAIGDFSKAIAIDKEFALPYAGLAEAYVFLSSPLGALKSNVAMPKAKEAAEKALRLNPNLSEAYVSLGAIATFYDWDSEKAHRYFKQAIELNPHNTNARLWYEIMLSLLDQNFDEALAHLTTALKQDPLNLLVRLRRGYIYCYKYDFKTAIRYFQQIVHAEPGNAAGYHGLMDIYGMKGEYDLAIREGEKAVEIGNYAVPFVSILGLYSARGGKIKRAQELLAVLLKRMETEYVSPFWIAVIYLGLNEYDKMFEWFDKAFEQRDGNLLYLFAPPIDPVRKDQRFIKLRQKMGFKK